MAIESGQMLGDYRIVGPIGAGGMGEVYLAEQVYLKKQFAVKVLPPELAKIRGFIDRFRTEAQVMAKLEHPRLVPIVHMSRHEGVFYIAMEYVIGPKGAPMSVADYLKLRKSGRLQPKLVRAWAIQIASALIHAHEHGIVHRDIKPGNVLLDAKGHTRLADFGLAKVIGTDFIQQEIRKSLASGKDTGVDFNTPTASMPKNVESLSPATTGNGIVGTYDYMSPEQRGDLQNANINPSTDIYSFGTMIYRLLTGKLPIGFATPPSRAIAGIDPRWDDVLAKCLAHEQQERYATAGELLNDLRKISVDGLSKKSESEADSKAVHVADSPAKSETATSTVEQKKSRFGLIASLVGGVALLVIVIAFALSQGSAVNDQETADAKPPPAYLTVPGSETKPDPTPATDTVALAASEAGKTKRLQALLDDLEGFVKNRGDGPMRGETVVSEPNYQVIAVNRSIDGVFDDDLIRQNLDTFELTIESSKQGKQTGYEVKIVFHDFPDDDVTRQVFKQMGTRLLDTQEETGRSVLLKTQQKAELGYTQGELITYAFTSPTEPVIILDFMTEADGRSKGYESSVILLTVQHEIEIDTTTRQSSSPAASNALAATPKLAPTKSDSPQSLAEARQERTEAAASYEQTLAQFDASRLEEHGGNRWRSVRQLVDSAKAEPAETVKAIERSTAMYRDAAEKLPEAFVEALANRAESLAAEEAYVAAESALAEARQAQPGSPLITASAEKVKKMRVGFTGQLAQFARASSIDVLQTNDTGTKLYASVDEEVIEYDLRTGGRLREFAGHTDDVTSLDVFGNDSKLITGSADKTAIIWDIATGDRLKMLPESNTVGAVAGSDDGRLVATAPLFKNPQIWTVQTGRPQPRVKIESWSWNSAIEALTFDRAGKRLLGGGTSYNTHVWSATDGRQQGILQAHKNQSVLALSYSRDGKSLVMLDASGIKVFDAARFKERFSLDVSARYCAQVTAAADDERFFAIDSVYDINSGELLERADIPLSQCRAATSTPDGSRFIYATSRSIVVVATTK